MLEVADMCLILPAGALDDEVVIVSVSIYIYIYVQDTHFLEIGLKYL